MKNIENSIDRTVRVSDRQIAAARQILVSPLAGQLRYDAEQGLDFWTRRRDENNTYRETYAEQYIIAAGHMAVDAIEAEEPALDQLVKITKKPLRHLGDTMNAYNTLSKEALHHAYAANFYFDKATEVDAKIDRLQAAQNSRLLHVAARIGQVVGWDMPSLALESLGTKLRAQEEISVQMHAKFSSKEADAAYLMPEREVEIVADTSDLLDESVYVA